jgi:hypothetical protein
MSPGADPAEVEVESYRAEIEMLRGFYCHFRTILTKYVRHIGEEEGTTFLSDADRKSYFTDVGWLELQAIDKEVS